MTASPRAVHLAVLMERQPSAQPIDFDVRGAGGTTTAFDLALGHRQPKTGQEAVKERIKELNIENGRVHYEAAFYANLANNVLRNLFPVLLSPISLLCLLLMKKDHLKDAIASPELGRYIEGLALGSKTGRTHNIVALSQSGMASQTNPSASPVNSPTHPRVEVPLSGEAKKPDHTLYGIIVSLTRDNGNMRQSIELNKNLVHVVLIKLIREVREAIHGICAVINQANIVIGYANNMWQRDVGSGSAVRWPSQLKLPTADGTVPRRKNSLVCSLQPLSLSSRQPNFSPGRAESRSTIELMRRYDILQYQSACYKWLINLAKLQLLPAIEYHLVELVSAIRDYRTTNRNARTLLRHKLRRSF